MAKKYPHAGYRGDPITRRELLLRGAAAATLTGGAGYLAFAPEHWPLSRLDASGLRGQPVPQPFRLPDFRVDPPANGMAIGVGYGGDRHTMLTKAIDALGGIRRFITPGDVVLIKPNVAFDRSPILGATTHPELLSALIQLVRIDGRAKEVRVADNPIESPADCFAKSGIRAASEAAGARVYLPDGNAFDLLETPGAKLIERWDFFRRPFADVTKVIGLSPIKDHNLCSASMGMKNWYGLLGGRRNQFHQDIHEIVSDLALMIRPTLTILDGTHVLMENGPTGGDPSYVKHGDRVLAGVDPVALDAYAYGHLLERQGPPPAYLAKAEAKGTGQLDYRSRVQEIS